MIWRLLLLLYWITLLIWLVPVLILTPVVWVLTGVVLLDVMLDIGFELEFRVP